MADLLVFSVIIAIGIALTVFGLKCNEDAENFGFRQLEKKKRKK